MKLLYLKEMLGRLVKTSRAADVSRNWKADMKFQTNERVTLDKCPLLICILFLPSSSWNSSLSSSDRLGTGQLTTQSPLPASTVYACCTDKIVQTAPHSQNWAGLGDLVALSTGDWAMNKTGSLLIAAYNHISLFHLVGSPGPQSWDIVSPSSSDHGLLYFDSSAIKCGKSLLSLTFRQRLDEVPSKGVSGKTG